MLKRSFISLVLFVPLIAIVIGGAFYFQYNRYVTQVTAQGKDAMSLAEYAQFSLDELKAKRAGAVKPAGFNLTATLPDAVEGWTRSAYRPSHGEQITGVLDEPGSPSVHTELEIQNDFRALKASNGHAAAVSYLNEGQIVSLWIKPQRMNQPTTWEDQAASEPVDARTSDGPVFATIDDVSFRQLPQISRHFVKDLERAAGYRRFEALIGDGLDLFVFTNAGDEAIKTVLSGIDFAALKTHSATLGGPAAAPHSTSADGAADVAAATAAPTSLASRISKLFSTKASQDEVEPPRRMTCKMRRGAKHCFFPDDE